MARWVHLPRPFGIDEATGYIDAAMALWDEGTGASFVIADRAHARLPWAR
ncbi:MAG: hypothetical protein R3C32_00880 [Chloroflexota bacterium]